LRLPDWSRDVMGVFHGRRICLGSRLYSISLQTDFIANF
jgi:hypothetical protein